MANTYRKVYLHIVFAVKNRGALLHKQWRSEVFQYIAKGLNDRGHYSLAVNGYHDHVHLFFDYNCKELIGDLVREIKKSSNQFIKEKRFSKFQFEWQSGYGVFSHGYRERDVVIKYIMNQEEHHGNKTFRQEYLALLKAFQIEYKDEYVFDFLD